MELSLSFSSAISSKYMKLFLYKPLTLTISTGIAATVTGILCSLLVIDGKIRILSYFILISLINFPLLVILLFYKINSYRQMRKYRNGKINLIKP